MLTEQEIRDGLKDRIITIVAKETNVSRFTLIKIRDGKAKNPAYSTMRRVSNYLEGKPIED